MKIQATHAVVLAAGRGSRLGSITNDLPKCLALVAGRTLLDWMIDTLVNAGIEKILVISGYRHEALQCYQSDRVEISYNARWAETNMLSTLMCAQDWLSAHQCIIAYSDIAVQAEYVSQLAAADGDIVVANNSGWRSLWQARFPDPLVDAETFSASDGVLHSIGGRAHSLDEIKGQFMGLLKTTPRGWKQLNTILLNDVEMVKTGDSTQLLSRALSKNVVVNVVDCMGGWIEIDTASDREIVEQGLVHGDWPHDWRR